MECEDIELCEVKVHLFSCQPLRSNKKEFIRTHSRSLDTILVQPMS